MAVDSATTSRIDQAAAREPRGSPHYRTRSRLRKLAQNVLHAADLQFRIFLLHAQINLRQIVVYTLLLIAAGLAASAALVLLSIAAFQALAAGVGTQGAFLILAAVYLMGAAILLVLANRILHKTAPDAQSPHATQASPPPPAHSGGYHDS